MILEKLRKLFFKLGELVLNQGEFVLILKKWILNPEELVLILKKWKELILILGEFLYKLGEL